MLKWILVLALISAPSGYIAWHGRDIPQLGFLSDDAIYFVSAKSLAANQGYRILSLPGAPAQTKYPPGYPALLSIVWRINPRFPDNLPIAALLAWIMLPLLLTMARLEFGGMGLGSRHATVLCALMAVSAPVVWFGINLMPELIFTSVLLASTLLADSERNWRWTVGAGLLAGIAYLLKSAALPLLLTSPLLFLLRKRFRSAALFGAAMFPFVAGWTWWAHTHRGPAGDSTWTFYTDYSAYQALNVPLHDYPLVVWVNLKTVWASLGELIGAPVFEGSLGHVPALAGGAIALAGIVMMVRRRGITHYGAFALGLLPLLAIWHYPPVARFAFPLLPLLLAGISTATLEAWSALVGRKPGAEQAAALTALAVLGALAPVAAVGTYAGPLRTFLQLTSGDRRQRAAVLSEYQWIKSNTPADAAFVANDDAVLYLNTGRAAMSLHIPPRLRYHEDRPGIAHEYAAIGTFAARNRLRYLLRTPTDFAQDFTPALGREIVDGLLNDARLFRPVHRSDHTTVYEIRMEDNAVTPGVGQSLALPAPAP